MGTERISVPSEKPVVVDIFAEGTFITGIQFISCSNRWKL